MLGACAYAHARVIGEAEEGERGRNCKCPNQEIGTVWKMKVERGKSLHRMERSYMLKYTSSSPTPTMLLLRRKGRRRGGKVAPSERTLEGLIAMESVFLLLSTQRGTRRSVST